MAEYDAVTMDRIMRRVTFDLFHWLTEQKFLTTAGLMAVRGRLDPVQQEWLPGPDRDLIKLEVDDALAEALGIDVSNLPGAELPPDSPGDIPPPRW